ncbi:MAG: class II aldolase/adducin family protein [Bacillaceae bacterium]|jgi:L-fuculose-phosphate aldolase|uniref:class II aldolase/adducin family protein n=1 Tax=Aeribacillus TaxID=1055323 RepID=UPI0007B4E1E2|nr:MULTISPECIES: class II aldolase/adducin family protein [Aeribacillus]REJ20954.1 MAG: class II aldolase/adducin family protein [Bacillaceae bacterium]KZM57548.1 aldolase [Aeribacillus pallidus]MDR9797917.1 class II aldolase/adducin family protein [Aeribacillus pallidus]MED0650635.1 class II aldolase/adducin family protein [Aeribacillus composti]MED0701344.1 class II aldolase/adducin family protein [Aeribacillus composti]
MSAVIGELKKYAHKIVDAGLVVGAGGNLSMRDGEYMYISPSGFDLKEIEDDQWVKVKIDTGEVFGDLKPSSELLMHLECFRRNPEINAVLHAHPSYSVGVSSAGKDIPMLFPDFPAMVKKVSYLDYIIPTTNLLADAVGEVIHDSDVIVMRNHGVLTVGKTMKEAFFYMQLTEESAKVFTIASTVGTPRILTEQECEDLRNLSSEKYRASLLKKKS